MDSRARPPARRRRSRTLLVGPILVIILLLIGIAHARSSPSGPVIRVPLTPEAYGAGGVGVPTLSLRVGHGPALRVILDTGSVGLRIFADRLGQTHGVTRTRQTTSVRFGDGSTFDGVVADGSVSIGGKTTLTPVPFQIVRSVRCPTATGSCSELQDEKGQSSVPVDGLLGTGLGYLEPVHRVVNPLLFLPAPYGQKWRVTVAPDGHRFPTGDLALGAGQPAHPLALYDFGRAGDPDDPYDYMPLCWTVGSNPTLCAPTLFDTGSSDTHIPPRAVRGSWRQPRQLPGGLSLALSRAQGLHPFLTFRSGEGPDVNAVQIARHSDIFQGGVALFRTMAVTYDVFLGRVTLSRPP